MSNQPASIPKYPEFSKSTDFNALKEQGIELLQQLSGDIWTDYNPHDPGVTILEQLIYVLTELGYKASLPVEDLLFEPDELPDPTKDALFPAIDILPTSPVTINDYRQLITDLLPEVSNAWVIPSHQNKHGMYVSGLYRAIVQCVPGANPESVIQKVKEIWHKNRNLCEDLESVELLTHVKISVQADINLTEHAIGETVLANICFKLNEVFNPAVRFFSFEDAYSDDIPLDKLFDGSSYLHGFISKDDLKKSESTRITTIQRAQIAKVMSEIEGVASIANLVLYTDGERVQQDVIKLNEGEYPELNIQELIPEIEEIPSTLTFYINGEIPYNIDTGVARYAYELTTAQLKDRYYRPARIPHFHPVSQRSSKDIAYYHSTQYDFPNLYGIGPMGLPMSASNKRKAQARQLKAYLMIFEQIMANYNMHLTKIRQLYAVEESGELSYFYQVPVSIPDFDLIVGSNEQYDESLYNIMRESDQGMDRRQKFLDHMLARFGEQFMAEAFNVVNRQASSLHQHEFDAQLIKAKEAYLKNIVDITMKRNIGYDYTKPEDEENVASIKKRIALLFGLQDYSDKPLSGIKKEKALTQEPATKKKANLDDKGFTFESDDPAIFETILAKGIHRRFYTIQANDKSGFTVNFETQNPEEPKIPVFQSSTLSACEDAIAKVIEYIRKLNHDSEGFHLIEHVLLRPMENIRKRIIISNKGRKALETDYIFEEDKEINSFLKKLSKHNWKTSKYEVTKVSGGTYVVKASTHDPKIFFFAAGYINEKEAKKELENIKSLLTSNGGDVSFWNSNFVAENRQKEETLFSDDPYSWRISLILPSWSVRFQSEKLMRLFENIVKLHLPAHLQVSFFWINMEEMLQFEEAYFNWRKLKADNSPSKHGELDDLSLQLLAHIKLFDNPEDFEYQKLLSGIKARKSKS